MKSPGYLKKLVETRSRVVKTSLTMKWSARSGGTFDPVTKETTGGTLTPHELPVEAVVHYVTPGDVHVKRFGEVKVNDVIVMFDAGVEIDAKDHLYFVLEGKEYEVKPDGETPVQSWGSVFSGLRLGRRVALQLRA